MFTIDSNGICIDYGEVNVVSLITGSRRLLVAVCSSLYLLDWAIAGDAALRLLTTVDIGLPDNVINEGKPDAEGRFWAGTKGPQTGDDVVPDKATFYSVEQESFKHPRIHLRPVSISNGIVWSLNNTVLYYIDSSTQRIDAFDFDVQGGHLNYGEVNIVIPVKNSSRLLVGVRNELHLMDWTMPGDSALSLEPPHFVPQIRLKPVSISNGLVWSLNNTIMYYIDSMSRKIEAFDFNLERAHISKRRTILHLDDYWDDEVIADGMTIDKDGFIWIALMFHGCIVRVDPDKKTIVERYKLPVSLTTSLTWGGPNLDDLIVTTSRRNMSPETLMKEPLSGAVFILHNMGTGGVQGNKFVFPNADTYK
ncbi:hypothetical protein HF086_002987 [Spodoptera exigua]|uniref:SMP-30/Gluconolactonase/LRE-like region domain-containing protein n=1 Tax=Spodoptera exigua TaxID=7107 RepID=A0A922MTV7_SPOEX|nr:hypothetical protein HF086_002987 [Spodoptera exigua]